MQVRLKAGAQQVGSGGIVDDLRCGPEGDLVVSQLHGPLYELARQGKLFSATNQAAQAVSVALATTYTGLCLSNPLGNTKNLVLLYANYALSVAPAGIASLHLIAGFSATANVTHTTPLVSPGIQNMLLGVGAPSSAKVDSAATIVNPGYLFPLMGGFTAAALPGPAMGMTEIPGGLVVPPGGWVALGALTAVTGFGGLIWEEVSI